MTNINIFKNKLVKTGTFDIDKIYSELKKWLSENNYGDHNYSETEKTTKLKPQGIEIVYKGEGKRELTDYFMFKLEFQFLFEHLKEVQKNGKKMYNGKAEMRMSINNITDYKKNWEKTKLARFLNKVYEEHLIKEKIVVVYNGKCYGEGIAFFQKMKETFDLYTF